MDARRRDPHRRPDRGADLAARSGTCADFERLISAARPSSSASAPRRWRSTAARSTSAVPGAGISVHAFTPTFVCADLSSGTMPGRRTSSSSAPRPRATRRASRRSWSRASRPTGRSRRRAGTRPPSSARRRTWRATWPGPEPGAASRTRAPSWPGTSGSSRWRTAGCRSTRPAPRTSGSCSRARTGGAAALRRSCTRRRSRRPRSAGTPRCACTRPADHGRGRRFYEREGWTLFIEFDDAVFGMRIAEYRRSTRCSEAARA